MKPVELWCGDCLNLMNNISDKSVDMILCDLPYGQTKRNRWDKVIPFEPLWDQYKRIIKDAGVIALFGNGMFTAELMLSNRDMWKYNIIWEKTQPTGFLNAKRQPLRSHEDICIFYNRSPVYNPQKRVGCDRKISTAAHKLSCRNTTNYGEHGLTTYDSTERYPTSVWKFAKDVQKSALHPTQKPIALLETLIKTYTDECSLVVDNCMGSGSTGVACVQTNRNFIGIELDEKYFNIAKSRIDAATNQIPVVSPNTPVTEQITQMKLF